jgi:glutamate racemase
VTKRTDLIGVFDSGLGGLTVYRALRGAVPNESLLYFGDTARLPYGTKSASTVIRYSSQIARFLLDQGIKYLVVACNTASAHALGHLREQLPVPVMGVVEPGAELAASWTTNGIVGVLGTLGTIESGAYHAAISRIDRRLVVVGQPCTLFVPLAEEGWLDGEVALAVARRYLEALARQNGAIDTIVLGCTHYPLLKDTIQQVAEEIFGDRVRLVDSAEAVARATAADLAQRGLFAVDQASAEFGRFLITDTSHFDDIAQRFLGGQLPRAELVDL